MKVQILVPIEKWVNSCNVGDSISIDLPRSEIEFRNTVNKLRGYLPYGAWSEASTASYLYGLCKNYVEMPYYKDMVFSVYVGD